MVAGLDVSRPRVDAAPQGPAHDDGEAGAPHRWSAGEDPAKRRQILDGAKRVFMRLGFDAASMSDITREAGVSKGTLYVYFENKEKLFAAIVESERAAIAGALRSMLADQTDLETGLLELGRRFAAHVTHEDHVAIMRIVLGVAPRMPDLCSGLFTGTDTVKHVLGAYLVHHVEAGRLRIDDLPLAIGQYLDLVSGTLVKKRLFGIMPDAPTTEEIDRVVAGAVRLFLAAYAVRDGNPPAP